MIRTQIQLTEEQHKFLREKAAEYNVSMAELVRQSIDLMAQNHQKPNREEMVRRAKALAGIATDIEGATDVSINHDKYLVEIYAEMDSKNDLD